MSRKMFRFAWVALLIAALAVASFPVAAQNTENCPEGRPTAQVRFYDFPDIPVYQTEGPADEANSIFSGAVVADQIPTPAFRIRGGSRQKYLLCGSFRAGDGSVRIVVSGGTVWAPEWLVESIVNRNWRDNQAGGLVEWGSR